MSLNDLVFWLGFIIGIALVLICTGILRYLKPSRTYDELPFFPMPSYSPLEAMQEDIRKLHGKIDEIIRHSPYSCSLESLLNTLQDLKINNHNINSQTDLNKIIEMLRLITGDMKESNQCAHKSVKMLSKLFKLLGKENRADFERLDESLLKLHHKFDAIFLPKQVTVNLDHLSQADKDALAEHFKNVENWKAAGILPVSDLKTDLQFKLDKVGLDKLTPVAKTNIADLDGETIYSDSDGRSVFSPTSVEIDGEKHPLLAGRTYMVDVNELRTIDIEFQAGNPAVNGVNGLTNELLLAILIDRTKVLDSEQPCEHNQKALTYMEMALDSFNARTQSRTQATMSGLPIDEVDKESHHH